MGVPTAIHGNADLVSRLLSPECHTVPVPISDRLWIWAGVNQCQANMMSLAEAEGRPISAALRPPRLSDVTASRQVLVVVSRFCSQYIIRRQRPPDALQLELANL